MTHIENTEEKLTLASLVGRRLSSAKYLVTRAEREAGLLDEHFHVLTHEVVLEVEDAKRVFFTWAEEPALNGHPIRLSVSVESSYESNPDLSWLDASDSACWSRAIGKMITAVRVFNEASAYEGVAPASVVTTGVELLGEGALTQITVITPPDDLNTPLSDWRWSPSTVVTVGCGVPDLSMRPQIRSEVIARDV